MDSYDPDDESLIQMIAQTRPDALGALYDRYGRLVFSVALSSVGDRATAEEITQDVFLRVWQHADQYRASRGKVSTWLTGITRNRSIDQLRRGGARPERPADVWAELSTVAEPAGGGPEQAAPRAMDRERVRGAMVRLPPEQRLVLSIAYFQGLSQSQIAERLGVPLGTVKTRVRLGMEKLREALADGQPEA